MTTYDPSLIQKFADKLYSQAASIIAGYTIFGAIIGYTAYHFFGSALPPEVTAIVNVWMVTVALGLVGCYFGFQRAFMLRFRAQTALCQLEIEKNTRAVRRETTITNPA